MIILQYNLFPHFRKIVTMLNNSCPESLFFVCVCSAEVGSNELHLLRYIYLSKFFG